YQTARILAPTDQLCAQEAHRLVLSRPNNVHLISTGDVYKRNLSKESYFTTARILPPTDQLCAQEAHRLVLSRPNNVHLISTGDVYKRNLSKESYFTPSTSPPWVRPKSCSRTSEIRL